MDRESYNAGLEAAAKVCEEGAVKNRRIASLAAVDEVAIAVDRGITAANTLTQTAVAIRALIREAEEEPSPENQQAE